MEKTTTQNEGEAKKNNRGYTELYKFQNKYSKIHGYPPKYGPDHKFAYLHSNYMDLRLLKRSNSHFFSMILIVYGVVHHFDQPIYQN